MEVLYVQAKEKILIEDIKNQTQIEVYSMKLEIRVFVILSVCCSLLGCSYTGDNQTSEKDAASVQGTFEVPQSIETELADNLTVKAQVTIPEKAKCGIVTCAVGKPVDFSGAEANLRRFFFEGDPEAVFETEEETVSLMGESTWLGYNDTQGLLVNSKEMQHRLNCISIGAQSSTSNTALYLEKENLPFMDQKDAFALIKEELGELGIQIGSVETCYVMDHKMMQQQEDTTDIAGVLHPELAKGEWKEQDDTYYFFMYQEYDGIPMIYNPYSGQGFLPGEECTAMVSEKGIIGCCVMGCYAWSEGAKVVLLPFEDVLETVRTNYGNNLVMDYEITSVDFYMDILPQNDGTAELRPVWSFAVTGKNLEGSCTFHIVIDGETGQELTENY